MADTGRGPGLLASIEKQDKVKTEPRLDLHFCSILQDSVLKLITTSNCLDAVELCGSENAGLKH